MSVDQGEIGSFPSFLTESLSQIFCLDQQISVVLVEGVPVFLLGVTFSIPSDKPVDFVTDFTVSLSANLPRKDKNFVSLGELYDETPLPLWDTFLISSKDLLLKAS